MVRAGLVLKQATHGIIKWLVSRYKSQPPCTGGLKAQSKFPDELLQVVSNRPKPNENRIIPTQEAGGLAWICLEKAL
jgi:hypothetical protein